ncbi:PREDICTED: late embryogenesis abundant protein D-34-like [Prunus mume]|uniref:Late embryogenesis abundant protein D-34-like n=1 Tax=Prunus mume TaxID=102107 RepID=A0ABM0NG45_PRUMU|nr:PREDICTED: late embryogenesis abundant protein D-34-like [Prunus mume]
MSQEQPRRPQEDEQQDKLQPIKYGDVFSVSGDLAKKPIAPQDANMMQTAETMVFGQTQKGGPAAVMQSAATRNERSGLVRHDQATDVGGNEGVTVTETDVPGSRIVTEAVGGQVIGQYVQPTPVAQVAAGGFMEQNAITIGEALEASAQTAGDKPIDQSDAAAIQAAEVRATGSNVISPGGLAAMAQSAAAYNAGTLAEQDKIKLTDVLSGATGKLPVDKAATRQDAEGIASAELRNNPEMGTRPGGVAASVTAAARLNENIKM